MHPRILKAFSTVLVLFILLGVGFFFSDDTGMGWDEPADISMVVILFRNIFRETPMGIWSYYGPFFNVTAEALYQTRCYLEHGLVHDPGKTINLKLKNPEFREILKDRINLKHKLVIIFSLLSYVSVIAITCPLVGVKWAWAAAVILALFPRYWANTLFNQKDIPFAALFSFGICCAIPLVEILLDHSKKNKKIYLQAVFFGLLVGFCSAIRIAGVILIPFVAITHFLLSEKKSNFLNHRTLTAYLVMSGVALITIYLNYPAFWDNPIEAVRAMTTFSDYKYWRGSLLFEGSIYKGDALPWFYVLKWFLITIPEPLLVLLVLGFALLLRNFSSMERPQKAAAILIFLQVAVLPFYAMIKRPVLYDSIRHFLFIIPGMAAAATVGMAVLYSGIQSFFSKSLKLRHVTPLLFLILAALSFSPVFADLKQLHPYQYVYFNRLSGGLKAAEGNYELDYWGMTLREAAEWLNQNEIKEDPAVLYSQPLLSAALFSKPETRVVNEEKDRALEGFYYIGLVRYGMEKRFPGCSVIHRISRQGVTFSVIKKCEQGNFSPAEVHAFLNPPRSARRK